MVNLFEGKPDGRQSDDVNHGLSRFRPTYRALTAAEKSLHDDAKNTAASLEAVFVEIGLINPKAGRHIALAMTKLEESIMWAIKGLTA